MSVDVATLGIRVDATDADGAKVKLDALAMAGAKVEGQTQKTEASARGLDNALGALAQALGVAAAQHAGASSASAHYHERMQALKASIDPFGLAQDRANDELREAAALYHAGAMSAQEYERAQLLLNDRIVVANAKQGAFHGALGKGTQAAKLQSHELLNLSRQFSDIGVTAAMGMNPLMILVQQGPQIGETFAMARQRGIGFGDMLKQVGGYVRPFIGLLAGIGVAAGVAFGAMGLASHALNDNLKTDQASIRKEFDLTEKQMERLKEKGTELGYTWGDVMAGIGASIKGAVTEALGMEIEQAKKAWDDFLDTQVNGAVNAMKEVVGTFAGAYKVIVTLWKMLPDAMADVSVSAANWVIKSVEDMVNASSNLINQLIDKIPEKLRPDGRVGTVSFGQIANPNKGAASRFNDSMGSAYGEGRASGEAWVDRRRADYSKGAGDSRSSRILEDAGKGDPTKNGPKARKAKESDEARDYKSAIEAAEGYIKSLNEEAEALGKNTFETKQLATARAQSEIMAKAMALGTAEAIGQAQELSAQMAAAQVNWEKAMNADAVKNMKREIEDETIALKFENSLIGMNAEERARATKTRELSIKVQELERAGHTGIAEEIRKEAKALIDATGARAAYTDATAEANRGADSMRDMADAVRETTESFGELFGTAGEGFANLLNTMFEFDAHQAESNAKLASLREERANGAISEADFNHETARTQEEMSRAQIAHYGNMIGAAKSFFKEGSTGFKILEGAERAYRLFQFAMQVRAMFMDTAQTTSSVANSGARAAADGIAAVAKAIASLPFPLNIVAGAATLAFLVALGVKMTGGGKSGAKGAATSAGSSKASEPAYNGPTDEYGAPTSGYSVLRPGQTVAGRVAGAGAGGSGGVTIGDTNLTVQGNVDRDTLPRIQEMLDANREATVQEARNMAARDAATRNNRQYIGGGA